ncbi:hypothetical protein EON65_15495 [archaeon]|nr:MAG: hypothetical protein EON65_15495 [archaeon]
MSLEQCQSYDPLPPRKSSSSLKIKIMDHTEGQHIVDDQTCHVKGYGPTGQLSYERRDLLVENLPDGKDFFSAHPVFGLKLDADQPARLPDVLVVQVARHACTLASLKEFKDADNWMRITEANQAKLMKQLQDLKQQLKSQRNHALNVILMLPGRALYNATTINTKTFDKSEYRSIYDDLDYCIWRLNGLMTFVAHEHGIPVHWREEIEHRLLLKTEQFYGTHDMQAVASNGDIAIEHVSFFNRPKCEQLVLFPGSQVVAASLIEMLHCFDKNQTFAF